MHGGGGGFRDWTNDSDVAQFAESGLVLVMPEGAASYYANAVDPPQDRYEDYLVKDLISDVESKFPVATGRSRRAIPIFLPSRVESARPSTFPAEPFP
ncbi:MAG TPA: hypothetical protein VIX37_21275 [Candidatus Sulfotelmatobacter sp.]